MAILIGILIFGIIVLVHEWGHYIVAVKSGILVEEFAIGMGPKLFRITKKDTLYTIRLLPIGGFCKMLGEDAIDKDPRAFNNKSLIVRMAVVLAGAFMNFIMAFILFTIVTFMAGYATTTIDTVVENSPAYMSGLRSGDTIKSIDGKKVNIFEEISIKMSSNTGVPVNVIIKRDNEKIHKIITPVADETGKYIIGIIPVQKVGSITKVESKEEFQKTTLGNSILGGMYKVKFWIEMTIKGIGDLFSAKVSIDQMAGPIGVVSVIGQLYDESIKESILNVVVSMLQFAALLSASIGMFNLLPVPALDGGRFIFYIIEAIFKKPVSPEIEGRVHFLGFVLLMALGVFIAFKDVMKLI